MTVYGKQEDMSLKSINRSGISGGSSGNVSRPGFMITDILALAANKQQNQEQLYQLQCAKLIGNAKDDMRMERINEQNKRNTNCYDSDMDDYNGGEYDADGDSSICSNGEYK